MKTKTKAKPKPAKPKKPRSSGYDHYEHQAEASRQRTQKGQEIGPLPPRGDPERWEACGKSLRLFLETYFPETFVIEWSEDHLKMIERTEQCIISGGLHCNAMPRGSGKTSVTVRAALWAMLYGYRRFVMVVAGTQPLAEKMLAMMRSELQFNPLLLEDFVEVCYPISKLKNEARLQARQTLDGENTLMKLTAEEIVFPMVPAKYGTKCSGSVVRVAGMTGAIRGQIATTASGATIRPDLVLCDDPQTRESAKSPTQNDERTSLINGDVLGLAGPKKTIACVMNCTVIFKNDLSDRFLSLEKNPAWGGTRAKLIYSFPKNIDLWDQYADIRRQSLRERGDNSLGNEFYLLNRQAMDEGALAGWPARFNADEHSAIQNAMNLKIDRPLAFASEYQNDPEADELAAGAKELQADEVAKRFNGHERMVVPPECSFITAFIDIGMWVHFYMVMGWTESYAGCVIDYGSWPKQNRGFFAAADARPKLRDVYSGMKDDQMVFASLQELVPYVYGRKYYKPDGGEMDIDRGLIDCGDETQAVHKFIRQTRFSQVTASMGFGRSTTGGSVQDWPNKAHEGEKRGHHWRLSPPKLGSGRILKFDADEWKSQAHARLTVPMGGKDGITLWGKLASTHEMLGAHCSSEYSTPVILPTKGVSYHKWSKRPGNLDNHLWDCIVGNTVAASFHGLQIRYDPKSTKDGEVKPKPISLRSLQEQHRQAQPDSTQKPGGKISLRELQQKQRAKR